MWMEPPTQETSPEDQPGGVRVRLHPDEREGCALSTARATFCTGRHAEPTGGAEPEPLTCRGARRGRELGYTEPTLLFGSVCVCVCVCLTVRMLYVCGRACACGRYTGSRQVMGRAARGGQNA